MKYFTFFIFILALSACEKNNELFSDSGDMKYGRVSAVLNGEDWLISAKARINSQNSSLFYLYTYIYEYDGEYTSPKLRFHNIPTKVGTYRLKKIDAQSGIAAIIPSALMYINDDTPGNKYFLQDNKVSCVKVTEIDTVNNHVEGEFEIHLKIEGDKVLDNFPDNLCFRKGKFSADLLP